MRQYLRVRNRPLFEWAFFFAFIVEYVLIICYILFVYLFFIIIFYNLFVLINYYHFYLSLLLYIYLFILLIGWSWNFDTGHYLQYMVAIQF